MTVTVGLDLSTTSCGIALYKDGQIQFTQCKPFAGTYSPAKLRSIVSFFDLFIKDYSVDIAIIEEPINIRNRKATISLSEVAGAVFALTTAQGGFADFIHNKTVKKHFRVKSKDDSVQTVKTMYPQLGDINNDESDAVLLVETYIQLTRDGVYNYEF